MIINPSYFVGDIHLPQVGEGASSVVNNNDLLNTFITKYEPEILIKGLGRWLYNDLKENLQENGDLKENSEQKWGNLLNGTKYTKKGVDFYWKGIVDIQGTYKKSFIADYVYYWYVKKNNSKLTTLGAVKPQAEGAANYSPIPKLTESWRSFYQWYAGDLETKPNTYYKRGVLVEDYFSTTPTGGDVSLFRFLSDHKEIYPNWNFERIRNKNSWGL